MYKATLKDNASTKPNDTVNLYAGNFGYVIKLPNNYLALPTPHDHQYGGIERVLFFPRGTPEDHLRTWWKSGLLSEAEYDQLKVIDLEVMPRNSQTPATLQARREVLSSTLTQFGNQFTIEDLALARPAFRVRITTPIPLVRTIIEGEKVLYTFTTGLTNPVAEELIAQLSELVLAKRMAVKALASPSVETPDQEGNSQVFQLNRIPLSPQAPLPESRFLGHYGYGINVPGSYLVLARFQDREKTIEEVLFFPRGTSEALLTQWLESGVNLEPDIATSNVITLRVTPWNHETFSRLPVPVNLDVMRTAIEGELKLEGRQFTVAESPLSLPAFQFTISTPHPLVQVLVSGQKVLYEFKSAPGNQVFNGLLGSLTEMFPHEEPGR